MSTEWLEDEEDQPIVALDEKGKKATEDSFRSNGWQYYLKIREYLPDWWYEFNGAVNGGADRNNYQRNKPKHRNIESFVKKKTKNKQDRQWLLWMIGPKKVWEREAISNGHKRSHKHRNRYQVPWLGDWYKRRRNGYWQTENKEQIKGLAKAIKDNVASSAAIRATAPFIVQDLMRWVRLGEKVDELFQGEPFYPDEKPNSKVNLLRFKLYKDMHTEIMEKKFSVIKEWMRI